MQAKFGRSVPQYFRHRPMFLHRFICLSGLQSMGFLVHFDRFAHDVTTPLVPACVSSCTCLALDACHVHNATKYAKLSPRREHRVLFLCRLACIIIPQLTIICRSLRAPDARAFKVLMHLTFDLAYLRKDHRACARRLVKNPPRTSRP